MLLCYVTTEEVMLLCYYGISLWNADYMLCYYGRRDAAMAYVTMEYHYRNADIPVSRTSGQRPAAGALDRCAGSCGSVYLSPLTSLSNPARDIISFK